ncbi:MAG: hypothetical protein E3J60_00595 [Dehalococcoidia bacterium]|nr:MAG: hypothetical protein E3J60_00595 [Dehalococcoidia bacterium]
MAQCLLVGFLCQPDGFRIWKVGRAKRRARFEVGRVVEQPPEVDTIMTRMASPSPDGADTGNSQDTHADKKPFHF